MIDDSTPIVHRLLVFLVRLTPMPTPTVPLQTAVTGRGGETMVAAPCAKVQCCVRAKRWFDQCQHYGGIIRNSVSEWRQKGRIWKRRETEKGRKRASLARENGVCVCMRSDIHRQ